MHSLYTLIDMVSPGDDPHLQLGRCERGLQPLRTSPTGAGCTSYVECDSDGKAMDSFEGHTHSFVIRIWREKLSARDNQIAWRGHITHVPGGERRYVQSLNDIALFILPYLERIGFRITIGWQMRRWLNRWK